MDFIEDDDIVKQTNYAVPQLVTTRHGVTLAGVDEGVWDVPGDYSIDRWEEPDFENSRYSYKGEPVLDVKPVYEAIWAYKDSHQVVVELDDDGYYVLVCSCGWHPAFYESRTYEQIVEEVEAHRSEGDA
jgi:hypothetical protein